MAVRAPGGFAAVRHVRRPVRRALVYWRRMPMWPLVASLPLSFLNLATRVADSPGARAHAAVAARLGPMLLGSFALLYSQLVLPTPSGAGAVELGFLGGAAGDLGERAGWLLLAWRFYTNGVGRGAGRRSRGAHLRLAGAPPASAAVERSRLASPSARAPARPRAARRPVPRRPSPAPPPASPRPPSAWPVPSRRVELVGARVGVNLLRLARLEAVEPHEQPFAPRTGPPWPPCPG